MSQFIINIEEIKKEARAHLEKGSVSQSYGLDQKEMVRILNETLATETVCYLRYMQHYYMAQGIKEELVAKEFLVHAEEERKHANKVAERITQLDGIPSFDPALLAQRSHAEYTERNADELKQMIIDNLISERIAVEVYTQIIRWIGDKDPVTRRLYEEILEDETEHADDMLDFLESINRKDST